MEQTLPILTSSTTAEVAIADSASLLDPVREVLPKAVEYIRRELRNTDLTIEIRPTTDIKRVPITSQERYEALSQAYPAVADLRERLGLRVL